MGSHCHGFVRHHSRRAQESFSAANRESGRLFSRPCDHRPEVTRRDDHKKRAEGADHRGFTQRTPRRKSTRLAQRAQRPQINGARAEGAETADQRRSRRGHRDRRSTGVAQRAQRAQINAGRAEGADQRGSPRGRTGRGSTSLARTKGPGAGNNHRARRRRGPREQHRRAGCNP